MSVRLKRTNSDIDTTTTTSTRPIKSITSKDEDYEPTSDHEADDPEVESRVTRGRSRSKMNKQYISFEDLHGQSSQTAAAQSPSYEDNEVSPDSLPNRTPTRSRANSKKKKPTPRPASPIDEITPEPAVRSPPRPRAGSTKKLSSVRKGSDARRSETAEYERKEADRRERLYKEEQLKQEQAQLKLAEERAKRRCGFCSWILIPFLSMILIGLLFGKDVLLAQIGGPTSVSIRSNMNELTRTISTQYPNFPKHSLQSLESAFLVHAQAFQSKQSERGSREHPDVDPNSADWLQASGDLLASPKPLVMVLATDGGDTPLAANLVRQIATILPGVDASPLPVLDLAYELRHRFHSPASDETTSYSSTLTSQQVKQVLTEFFDSTFTPIPSLQHGLVFIRSASSMPREASQLFHRYCDDMVAPMTDTAFIFEVDATHASQNTNRRIDAQTAVIDELTIGWTKKQRTTHTQPSTNTGTTASTSPSSSQSPPPLIDEVLEPLLSRVVRNVIDMRL